MLSIVHYTNNFFLGALFVIFWCLIGWVGFIIFCYIYNQKFVDINRYEFACLFLLSITGGPFTFFASLVTDLVESRKKNVRR